MDNDNWQSMVQQEISSSYLVHRELLYYFDYIKTVNQQN